MSTHSTIALLFVVPIALNAQEYRANLLGIVTDSSGAAVAEASVKATNIETGVVSASKTNHDGTYLIPFLLPGRYSLAVEQTGFKAFERSPIELRVNDRSRVDVVLEVSQISYSVTVVAENPLPEISS